MSIDELSGGTVDRQAKKASEMAEKIERMSNGVITKRQAEAYLLLNEAGRTVPDISDHLDADVDTIYTLRHTAHQKIEGAQKLAEFFDKE